MGVFVNELNQAEAYVGGDWDNVRGLLGGKGANLAEMNRIGLPVPPFFTVTTEACNAYIAGGNKFPPGMWDEVLVALKDSKKHLVKNLETPLTLCWSRAVQVPSSRCPE